jgi:hypothetical protein
MSFFKQLRRLICDNIPSESDFVLPNEQLNLATQDPLIPNITPSSSTSKKRPNSLTIGTTSPTKIRPQSIAEQSAPRTPDQPTIPKNPDNTGDSIESIDEDNTRDMIRTFLRTSMYHLGRDFIHLSWPSYAQKCRLDISGSVNPYSF